MVKNVFAEHENNETHAAARGAGAPPPLASAGAGGAAADEPADGEPGNWGSAAIAEQASDARCFYMPVQWRTSYFRG